MIAEPNVCTVCEMHGPRLGWDHCNICAWDQDKVERIAAIDACQMDEGWCKGHLTWHPPLQPQCPIT